MEIKFENVCFSYGNNKTLDNINLTFKEKTAYGILGKSGSGKTTLALLIDAIYSPTEGRITFGNYKVGPKTKIKKTLHKSVSMVFQNADEQFFEDTVYNEVLFGIRNLKLPQKDIDDKIKKIFQEIDLDESVLNKNPFLLSNGEKRKVAIASILLSDPDVIILDEPTIGLDYKGKELLRKLIIRLKKKKTVIVISHDVDFLHKVIDNVIIIQDGKIIKEGNKYDVFKDEKSLKKIKIAVPEIMQFINLINKKVDFDYYDDIKELMKAVYRDVK